MNSIQVLIALSVLLGLAACQLPFKDCGSKFGVIKSVYISQCTGFPCTITAGTYITVEMKFMALANFTMATSELWVESSHVRRRIPLHEDNACYVMKCPVKANSVVDYKMNLLVSPKDAMMNASADWMVMPPTGRDPITCFSGIINIVLP